MALILQAITPETQVNLLRMLSQAKARPKPYLEMKFYPGGPTGAEYVYGGIADAGLGAINALMAGFGAGAGFVAEQVPFQNENQEDRLSRELLAFGEFAEQYLTPYFGAIGIFSKLGKASKAATAANRAPEVPVAVATEPQITIAPTFQWHICSQTL